MKPTAFMDVGCFVLSPSLFFHSLSAGGQTHDRKMEEALLHININSAVTV